jgi:hypothetical protein
MLILEIADVPGDTERLRDLVCDLELLHAAPRRRDCFLSDGFSWRCISSSWNGQTCAPLSWRRVCCSHVGMLQGSVRGGKKSGDEWSTPKSQRAAHVLAHHAQCSGGPPW